MLSGSAIDLSSGADAGSDEHSDPLFFLAPTSGTAGNGLPIYNWDQAAAQLTRDGLSWSGLGTSTTVTYAYRSTAPGAMPEDTTGFSRFNATQIAVAEEALRLWAEVAGISFTRVDAGDGYSDNAVILLGNYSAGESGAAAFAYLPGSRFANAVAGDVWVNISLPENQDLSFGSYGQQVIIHELGHAIGLDHPGDYNGGAPVYPDNATYYQDSRMYTVMSYFGSGGVGGSLGAFSNGPQLHDIAAAQRLYGANMTTRTGDTTYGFNSNAGHQHFTATAGQPAVFSIWDAGGNDTLDLSGFTTNSEIDLRPESFSSAGPGNSGADAIGNISIARGAIIENGIGGGGDDTMIGNDVANVLTGNGGADNMTGGLGNDTLIGGTGNDTMVGGDGNDTYFVDSLGDVVTENSGEGGGDAVLVTVSGYTLTANVEVGAVNLGSGLTLTGNGLDNVLYGNTGADTLNGGLGNDTLIGQTGADAMAGGQGNDTYWLDNVGDTIIENPGEGTGDAVIVFTSSYTLAANVEVAGRFLATGYTVTGNGLDNQLYGNAGADTLDGGIGNDTIGGGAGNDTMIGGTGDDTFYVEDAGDIITEAAGAGGGLGDAVIVFTSSYTLAANVEVAGRFLSTGYTLIGNELDNRLYGNNGADIIDGGDGNDTIGGGAGNDTMIGGLGNDTFYVEDAGDVVTENSGEGTGDAVIVFISSYTLAANVEVAGRFLSTAYNLTGNELDNRLYGNAGADTINGAGGNDVLEGGGGADTLTGGTGNDVFQFVAGGANGDIVTDFAGNGAAAGDVLQFYGYGTLAGGATFIQLDATHWQINSANGLIHDTITTSNGAAIDASDWAFV